ncbi:MAG: NBR1-Ig-like domain-containing protein, partial [Chloroflexi bacterium]|nr:NBR1-Ig-like domain-containing protein [Chloroflexota bacterium]
MNRLLLLIIGTEIIALVVLGFVVVGAVRAVAIEQPGTVIDSPPSNSVFHAGDQVVVQSTSTDSNNISHVELSVDGEVVSIATPSQLQSAIVVTQTWTATEGMHTLSVRSFDQNDLPGNPAEISVSVLAAESPAAPATVTPVPTATPTETPTATQAPPLTPTAAPSSTATPTSGPVPLPVTGCTYGAAFQADVTIPDGTVVAPYQTFDKVWQLLNTGTCAWGDGFTFTYVGGYLDGTSAVSVPYTPPGGTVDLVVPMTAPAAAGPYYGYWRLRDPAGAFFGATPYVSIDVVAYTIATATPTYGCSGVPYISYFVVSASTINLGETTTLYWGLVGNATYAGIDNGIGGVVTPGSVDVTPGETTTYTLTAVCGSNYTTAEVTVSVVQPTAVPTATPVPATATPTNTPVPATPTATPTQVPSSTATPTATHTPSPTATNTPSPTATNTPSPTATNTPSPTATNTPSPTATNTPS